MNLYEADVSLFFLINKSLQNRLFDVIMPFATGNAHMLFLFCLIALFVFKDRRYMQIFSILAVSIIAAALSDWFSYSLKNIFLRPRPCAVLDVNLLTGCAKSFSMPSNHAANTFAFAMPFIVLLKDRVRYIFIFVAAVVSFSRVYVGVHYPADVLIGALLGTAMSMAVIFLYRKSEASFRERPAKTAFLLFALAFVIIIAYLFSKGLVPKF